MISIHQILFFLVSLSFLPIHKFLQLRLTVRISTGSSLDILGLSFSVSIKAA